MSNPISPLKPSVRKDWLRPLARAAGELNVLLVVFAIGLAVLDLTFLFSERVIDRLPQVIRVIDVEPPVASPSRSSEALPR